MNLNPFAKEFSPSVPFAVKSIKTRREDDTRPQQSNNSLNHPNVRPGQCSFDLPDSLLPASAVPRRVQQLSSAPTSSSASASGADEEHSHADALGELDEASLLEHHHALQAQPSLTVSSLTFSRL